MTKEQLDSNNKPQCQFFVLRKKRLCRMTVRPGKNYCGEHEPQPRTEQAKDDTRIPCPNDPKHTCYISKLEKHLAICNARQQPAPDYIQNNVNAPPETDVPRKPLSVTPVVEITELIDKVNSIYNRHIAQNIETLSEREIHAAVMEDWQTTGRTESSLRHLRQASRIMHLIEEENLVCDNTIYLELGAGKGHLSYFAWRAWCTPDSRSSVLLVERASLRHKRDNKIREVLLNHSSETSKKMKIDSNTVESESHVRNESSKNDHINDIGSNEDTRNDQVPDDKTNNEINMDVSFRLRADLAHLVLDRVPAVKTHSAVIGFAKHLCGVATDYSLRCLTAGTSYVRGVVIATCCHHRCQPQGYVANEQLQQLGINKEDFNIIVGIVSWATCGDGRSRDKKLVANADPTTLNSTDSELGTKSLNLTQEARETIGRRAKALLDWGRVLYLRERGFDARLAYYVPTTVSLENVCIIAKKIK